MLSHGKVSTFLHLKPAAWSQEGRGSDLSYNQKTFQKETTVYRALQLTESMSDSAKEKHWPDCLTGPPGLCPAFTSAVGGVISPLPPPPHP